MTVSAHSAPSAEQHRNSGDTDNREPTATGANASPAALPLPLTLAYAPPAKDPGRVRYALLAGIVTTGLTLLLVWFLNARADVNVMGWYPKLLPIGALLVGLAATSGYAIACWWWGVKVTRRIVLAIVTFQACSYAAAHYLEFRAAGPLFYRGTNRQVGFVDYYHIETMSFTWGSGTLSGGSKPKPIGAWGYIPRTAEVLGYLFGGLITMGVVARASYCELCQRYMKSKRLAIFPASVRNRKVSSKDADAWAAYVAEHKEAEKNGRKTLDELLRQASIGDADAFRRGLAHLKEGSRRAAKLPNRIHLHMIFCPNCGSGLLQPSVVTSKDGQQQPNVARLPPLTLQPEFVRRVAAA